MEDSNITISLNSFICDKNRKTNIVSLQKTKLNESFNFSHFKNHPLVKSPCDPGIGLSVIHGLSLLIDEIDKSLENMESDKTLLRDGFLEKEEMESDKTLTDDFLEKEALDIVEKSLSVVGRDIKTWSKIKKILRGRLLILIYHSETPWCRLFTMWNKGSYFHDKNLEEIMTELNNWKYSINVFKPFLELLETKGDIIAYINRLILRDKIRSINIMSCLIDNYSDMLMNDIIIKSVRKKEDSIIAHLKTIINNIEWPREHIVGHIITIIGFLESEKTDMKGRSFLWEVVQALTKGNIDRQLYGPVIRRKVKHSIWKKELDLRHKKIRSRDNPSYPEENNQEMADRAGLRELYNMISKLAIKETNKIVFKQIIDLLINKINEDFIQKLDQNRRIICIYKTKDLIPFSNNFIRRAIEKESIETKAMFCGYFEETERFLVDSGVIRTATFNSISEDAQEGIISFIVPRISTGGYEKGINLDIDSIFVKLFLCGSNNLYRSIRRKLTSEKVTVGIIRMLSNWVFLENSGNISDETRRRLRWILSRFITSTEELSEGLYMLLLISEKVVLYCGRRIAIDWNDFFRMFTRKITNTIACIMEEKEEHGFGNIKESKSDFFKGNRQETVKEFITKRLGNLLLKTSPKTIPIILKYVLELIRNKKNEVISSIRRSRIEMAMVLISILNKSKQMNLALCEERIIKTADILSIEKGNREVIRNLLIRIFGNNYNGFIEYLVEGKEIGKEISIYDGPSSSAILALIWSLDPGKIRIEECEGSLKELDNIPVEDFIHILQHCAYAGLDDVSAGSAGLNKLNNTLDGLDNASDGLSSRLNSKTTSKTNGSDDDSDTLSYYRVNSSSSLNSSNSFSQTSKEKYRTRIEIINHISDHLGSPLDDTDLSTIFQIFLNGNEQTASFISIILKKVRMNIKDTRELSKLQVLLKGKTDRYSAINLLELLKYLEHENIFIRERTPRAIRSFTIEAGKVENTLSILMEKYREEIRRSPRWHLKTESLQLKRRPIVETIFLFKTKEVFQFIVNDLMNDPSNEFLYSGFQCCEDILNSDIRNWEVYFNIVENSLNRGKDVNDIMYGLFIDFIFRDEKVKKIIDCLYSKCESIWAIAAERIHFLLKHMNEKEKEALLKERIHSIYSVGILDKNEENIPFGLPAGLCNVLIENGVNKIEENLEILSNLCNFSILGARCLNLLNKKLGIAFEPFLTILFPKIFQLVDSNNKSLARETEDLLSDIINECSPFLIDRILDIVIALFKGENNKELMAGIHILNLISDINIEYFEDRLNEIIYSLVSSVSILRKDSHKFIIHVIKKFIENMDCPELRGSLSNLALSSLFGLSSDLKEFLVTLTETVFIYSPDNSALAFLIPPITKGLSSRDCEVRRLSCMAVGTICVYSDPDSFENYIDSLVKGLYSNISDPVAEVSISAAQALGLIAESSEGKRKEFSVYFMSKIKDAKIVSERAGAAEALAEVMKYEKEKDSIISELNEGMESNDVKIKEGMCLFIDKTVKSSEDIINSMFSNVIGFLSDCLGSCESLLRETSKHAFLSVVIKTIADEDKRLKVKKQEVMDKGLGGRGQKNKKVGGMEVTKDTGQEVNEPNEPNRLEDKGPDELNRINELNGIDRPDELISKIINELIGSARSQNPNRRSLSIYILDILIRCVSFEELISTELMEISTEEFIMKIGEPERIRIKNRIGKESLDIISVLFYLLRHDNLVTVKNTSAEYWKFLSNRNIKEIKRLFPEIINEILSHISNKKESTETLMEEKGFIEAVRKTGGENLKHEIIKRLKNPEENVNSLIGLFHLLPVCDEMLSEKEIIVIHKEIFDNSLKLFNLKSKRLKESICVFLNRILEDSGDNRREVNMKLISELFIGNLNREDKGVDNLFLLVTNCPDLMIYLLGEDGCKMVKDEIRKKGSTMLLLVPMVFDSNKEIAAKIFPLIIENLTIDVLMLWEDTIEKLIETTCEVEPESFIRKINEVYQTDCCLPDEELADDPKDKPTSTLGSTNLLSNGQSTLGSTNLSSNVSTNLSSSNVSTNLSSSSVSTNLSSSSLSSNTSLSSISGLDPSSNLSPNSSPNSTTEKKGRILVQYFARTEYANKTTFSRTLLYEKWLMRCVDSRDDRTLGELLLLVRFDKEEGSSFQICENVIQYALRVGMTHEVSSRLLEICTRALFTDGTVFIKYTVMKHTKLLLENAEVIDDRIALGMIAALLKVMNARLDDGSRIYGLESIEILLNHNYEDISMYTPEIAVIMVHFIFDWPIKKEFLLIIENIIKITLISKCAASIGNKREIMMKQRNILSDQDRRSELFEKIKNNYIRDE
eukprot:GHVP01011532.1.p1 GENE.GHVP01011532.1~~GHVP01011532.1.p1  ORF type:complete len:2322 (+),score=423.33 GHVP01011532.1:4-6969(+)